MKTILHRLIVLPVSIVLVVVCFACIVAVGFDVVAGAHMPLVVVGSLFAAVSGKLAMKGLASL